MGKWNFLFRQVSFVPSLTMHTEHSFYWAIGQSNAIFGKVGRIASEAVTLHLLASNFIPISDHKCMLLNKDRLDNT